MVREKIKILPHWMFTIENMVREAVEHMLAEISKGDCTCEDSAIIHDAGL